MRAILFLWLIYGGLVQLNGEMLVVVAGENFCVNSLEIRDIRSIYLAKRFHFCNKKILPLNFGIDNPLRNKFEENILEENRNTLMHNWLQAHYLGHHAPKVFKSPEAVGEFLSKVDNSLGYMDEETAQKYHLKILFRFKE